MLTTKRSFGEFHVIWSPYVAVGESEWFVIPRIKSVLVARPQVAYFGFRMWLLENPFHQIIIPFRVENDRNWHG